MHPEEQLSAYLDGELSRDERDAIESHLIICPSCKALLQDLMELQQTFTSAMFALSEPAGLDNRILQAVEREDRIRSLGKLWMIVPLLSVMVFVLLALAAGPVVLHVVRGALVIGRALLYTASLAVADMPMLAGGAIILSLAVLVTSVLSLRRLLRSAAV